jgi:hypothetical protein
VSLKSAASGNPSRGASAPARGPDAVRSEASEFRREESKECVQVRGINSEATGRLLAGNINDRANVSGSIIDLPRRNERAKERMAFGMSRALARA